MAGVPTATEGEYMMYSYPGYMDVYTNKTSMMWKTVSKPWQNEFEAALNANGMVLGVWFVKSQFEVESTTPLTITYRVPGNTSQKTVSVNNGLYTMDYGVEVGRQDGIVQGYLTFINSQHQTGTSMFNLGASFDQK